MRQELNNARRAVKIKTDPQESREMVVLTARVSKCVEKYRWSTPNVSPTPLPNHSSLRVNEVREGHPKEGEKQKKRVGGG